MSSEAKHSDFEIQYLDHNEIRITTDGLSVSTEYIPDESLPRTRMSAANLFFSALAL